jgi:Putative endonuclease segE, GIY-YIG domain
MWLYKGSPFEEPEEQHYGFVYKITNLTNQKTYIGKKLFWFKKTRMAKGKKKRYLAPSDWKDYYGSSIALQKDIQQIGVDNFKREIIILCKNKGECSYYEAKAQFDHGVLFNPELYYNDWIICRVHRKHVYETATPKIRNKTKLSSLQSVEQ